MGNSVLDQLQKQSWLASILGGGNNNGVTVPVQQAPQVGPNLPGPAVTMPGPPVTVQQPPPGAVPPGQAPGFWEALGVTPDTSSVANFLTKGASGQGNIMDTINKVATPFYGAPVQDVAKGLSMMAAPVQEYGDKAMAGIEGGLNAILPGFLGKEGMASQAMTGLANFFGGNIPTEIQAEADAAAAQGVPFDAQAAWRRYAQLKGWLPGANGQGGGQGGDGLGMLRGLAGGGQSSIELGQTPELPAPPMETAPQGIDLAQYQQWLEAAKPQAPDQAALDNAMFAQVMQGLGAGLANGADYAGRRRGMGQFLLAAGGGALQGAGQGKQVQGRMKERQSEQEREYAGMRANASLGEAKLIQDDAEAARQVDVRNSERAYRHLLAQREEAMPKILGASEDGVIYQTNEGGKQKVQIFSTGNSAKLQLARALGGRQAALQAGQQMGQMGMLHALAGEVVNSGMAEMFLGDAWNDVRENAMEQIPAYQEGKASDAALSTALQGQIVQLMLKDPGLQNSVLQYMVGNEDPNIPTDAVIPPKKKGQK